MCPCRSCEVAVSPPHRMAEQSGQESGKVATLYRYEKRGFLNIALHKACCPLVPACLQVGKGNRPRADFRLPLRDANDNPYSSMAGDPPLRVKLHAQGYGANGRPPVRQCRAGTATNAANGHGPIAAVELRLAVAIDPVGPCVRASLRDLVL